jgi:hypothetical protein
MPRSYNFKDAAARRAKRLPAGPRFHKKLSAEKKSGAARRPLPFRD